MTEPEAHRALERAVASLETIVARLDERLKAHEAADSRARQVAMLLAGALASAVAMLLVTRLFPLGPL
jgi:exonuclease VII small subunit